MSLCESGTIGDPHADVVLLGRVPEVGIASLANTPIKNQRCDRTSQTHRTLRGGLTRHRVWYDIETWMGRSPSPNDLVSEIVDGPGGSHFRFP
jgi:hypothetical protein